MGGNALKETFTRRYLKGEYEELRFEILGKFRERTSNRIETILAYKQKESFGDMDILIESENINYNNLINELFHPKQIFKNGNVYSFDVQELQIDLIITPTAQYNASVNYFAWNDLGNLMGRIYKKLGFKYGHKGLNYVIRTGDYIFKELSISTASREIFEFGDYDYDRFLEGFETLEDIFGYVTTSKYFNKDIFLLHNRNHRSRVRDAKRPSYNAFLKYCETVENKPTYLWNSNSSKGHMMLNQEKSRFLNQAFNKFNAFKTDYDNAFRELNENIKFKNKYSGEQVMYQTGLCKKELGLFMQIIKKNNPDLKEFVLESNAQEITDFILEEFERFRT